MTSMPPEQKSPWSALRRFARPRPPVEPLQSLQRLRWRPSHRHLLEPANRQMHCSCDPCAILFSGRADGRYRRVEPRIELLTGFHLSDAQWDDFHLPINLAYFVRSSVAGRVQAYFPSPAGATESLLTLGAWDTLAADNPVLNELDTDVEALLVNRLGRTRAHYRVSIDECFTLVGLIRSRWRGLSGGTAVWEEIGRFFQGLDARSQPPGGTRHAGPEL